MQKQAKRWEKSQIEILDKAIMVSGSQSNLAKYIGVHRQVISRWKLCQTQMSLESYMLIKQYLSKHGIND